MNVVQLKYPGSSQKWLFGIKLNQTKLFLLQESRFKCALHRKGNYGNSAEVKWWHRSGSPGDASGLNTEGDRVGFMEIKRRAAPSLPSFSLPWLKRAKIQSVVNPKPPRLNMWSHQSRTTTLKPDYNCKEDSLRERLGRANCLILLFLLILLILISCLFPK